MVDSSNCYMWLTIEDNATNKAHKEEQNVHVTVCSVFFFKDAYASMKGTINFF